MSFSATSHDAAFGTFLEDALTRIQEHVPNRHAEMLARLTRRSGEGAMVVVVDSERLALIPERDALLVSPATPEELPILWTTGAVIIALLDGELELTTALRENHLRLRGAPSDLVSFHAALMAFLEGCVRAPGLEHLLRRYRATVTDDMTYPRGTQ